nr:FAD-dependent oxidoreductase [uncultured Tateyamaria sp.]
MAGLQGPITLIGDEAELPYERPPLCAIFPDDWYQGHDITARAGNPSHGDRSYSLDRSAEQWPHLFIHSAFVGDGRISPPDTTADVRLRYVRTYADAQRLAQEVSAGGRCVGLSVVDFIGLELAGSLLAHNAFVQVIEAQDRILARAVALAIAQKILHLHAEHGVTIHIGTAVNAVEDRVAFLSSRQSVRAEQVTARRNMCGGRFAGHVQGVCLHCGGWSVGAIYQVAPAAIFQTFRNLG